MELKLLDSTLAVVKVVDVFDSAIWTDRYFGCGDFELVNEASIPNILLFREDYFLQLKDSVHTMIIETLNLTTDIENGNKFVVKGRSLESILERRIIWNQTSINGSLQEGIKTLLNNNAIVPSDSDRKISKLVFVESTDPAVTALSINAQFMGENLYEVIQQLCQSSGIGFKITLSATNQFEFMLYSGVDRSYDQLTNPFVAFSPDLDNLSNTSYYHTNIPFRTITLVGGEGDGSSRKTATVPLPAGGGSDLARREKFTDAASISSLVDGATISDAEYQGLLQTQGLLSLIESQPASSFDGKVDYSTTYLYGRDFFLGDIVQVANEYGLGSKTRVTEIIFSEDLSGTDTIPTFEMMT